MVLTQKTNVGIQASWSWSLRAVVRDLLGERTPAHTTLHGWTEGLGAHALGLRGAQLGGAPFSRFLVEPQDLGRRGRAGGADPL